NQGPGGRQSAGRFRLFPGPRLAGHLRARLPGRALVADAGRTLPPRIARTAGTLFVSAPLADARFLALPDGFDGAGLAQRDLSGAVYALHGESRTDRAHGPQGLGVPGRRRDGRT